ncbi:keratin [Agrobacterium rubi]|nr:keratin [Agrobacterium rubi]NTF24311.1 keratin [Agrobacterium rubi]
MKDSKNIARIEALRGEFEKLRNTKIRIEADIDRAAADTEKFKAAAREEIGTDNLDEIRGLIRKLDDETTSDVNAFESLMAEIRNGIAQLVDVQPTQPEARASSGFRRAAG